MSLATALGHLPPSLLCVILCLIALRHSLPSLIVSSTAQWSCVMFSSPLPLVVSSTAGSLCVTCSQIAPPRPPPACFVPSNAPSCRVITPACPPHNLPRFDHSSSLCPCHLAATSLISNAAAIERHHHHQTPPPIATIKHKVLVHEERGNEMRRRQIR